MQRAADHSLSAVQADRVDELAALYRLTDSLYRAQSLQQIYDAALDVIIAALGCERASILLFNAQGVMEFVAWRGLSAEYREILRGHSPWKLGERDPDPIFVTDIDETAEPDWVKAMIRKEGIRALGFIPLVVDGAVIGKFMAYYPEPRTLQSREFDLAVNITLQLGFSLQRGPKVTHPKRRGFGSLLLERNLASDLNGKVTIDFPPEGLVCTIEAPLAATSTADWQTPPTSL